MNTRESVRVLCLLLVIQAVVSYRSVPRILKLVDPLVSPRLSWIPHFSSVINWSLRLGLGLLKQVGPLNAPWLAIIDHSIDVGTKKAMVVLRVRMAALSERKAPIQLKDCECIGLTVCEQVNGEIIAEQLEVIFAQAGQPAAILKDCDASLQKGVRLWSQRHALTVPVIEDIGHVIACALKAQFEKSTAFKRFTALISQGAKCLRQTELAFLMPPKLRRKGRFQSISKLGRWSEKILAVFEAHRHHKQDPIVNKLRTILPGFMRSRPFIERFAKTTQVASELMKILKHHGLDDTRYKSGCQLVDSLPKRSKVTRRLRQWLHHHQTIQQQLGPLPLLVSSDIIESLFGHFKHIIERSPQADLNRTALLIPALCGPLNETTITQALRSTPHEALKQWERANIPYTLRKKRQAFFDQSKAKKREKIIPNNNLFSTP